MKSIKCLAVATLMLGAVGMINAETSKSIMFSSMLSPDHQDIKFKLTFDNDTSASEQFLAKDLAMGKTVSIPVGDHKQFTLRGFDEKGNEFAVVTYEGKQTLPIQDGRRYSLSLAVNNVIFAAY